MGMEDRDHYREWWNKKTGYIEKAKFRRPSGWAWGPKKNGKHQLRLYDDLPESQPQQKDSWHWSLMLVVWLLISAVLFAVVRHFR